MSHSANPRATITAAEKPEPRTRANKTADSQVVGGIELDRQNMRVLRDGRVLRLSPIEFRLFDLLMSNPGKAFSRKELMAFVWGCNDLDQRTVDVTVGRMRKAINRGWMPDPIRSVRFRGYMFNDRFDQISRAWDANGQKKLRLGRRPLRPVALASDR